MKATGIVRRIDDLGRVVIPKEIRRTMRIREGEPLEIFTDAGGSVIFKKYSPVGELSALAVQLCDAFTKACGLSLAVCDRDGVIAASAGLRRELDGFELEFLENTPVSYRCYCSRERVTSTLIAIGRKDLEEIVAEGKPINLECQFCDQVYTFTPEEISDLLKEI